MEKIDITIVGAGIVGLSIAAKLSLVYQDIFVIDKYPTFGQETSSRNSEVIHAGIYYPRGTLKTKTCVEGRRMLYEFCARNNIPHKKIGKLIVAINKQEIEDLNALFKHGLDNAVEDLRFIPKNEIKDFEPNIRAEAAIYSPSTGILDTHSFMKTLASQFESRSGSIAYNTKLTGVEKTKEGFIVTVHDAHKSTFKFLSRIFINCAGLDSDKVSGMLGLSTEEYRLKYCKGDYFRVSSAKAKLINRLVYPVPKKDRAGLGIHATLDLAGSLRLGPDDEYVKEINYDVDPQKAEAFYQSTRQFFPFIELKDLSPDMAGVRPKLQGPREGFRDFIIKDEAENGLPGFINLIGIESPGLTSSLSIAKMVTELVK